MSLLVKAILSTVFLGTGVVAVMCMLTLMGRAQRKMSVTVLRRMHRVFGLLFLVLLLLISYFCLGYVKMAGEDLSGRAVFHGVLAVDC
ncbi:MAG: DUF6529 family protein [bacterium]